MIEVRQVQQFVHKPEAAEADRLPYQDAGTAKLSYKTFAEFVAWLQAKEIGLTQEQVLSLLGDYYTKAQVDALLEAFEPGNPDTGYTQATLEAASTVLNFSNPLGHIRNEALTGAQTFTKTGATLGTTVVQAYTATGSGALSFDFAHSVLNSEFASGQALAQGDYKLFFSNWGDIVAVSIAQVGAGTEPEEPVPNSAPVITLAGANPMTLSVGDTYTEPGATATDSEDGDISTDIVITGTVNTAVAGTYTRYYNVSDSQGLAAVEVTRTVQVNAQGVTTLNAPGNFTATASGETTINLTWTDTNA